MKFKFEFELKGSTCLGCPFQGYFDNWDIFVCRAKDCKRNDSLENYPDEIKDRPKWCPLKVVENDNQ